MQIMTAETAALLKSRSMIGANKPAHRVTIGGGARSFTGITKITQGIGTIAKDISNWVGTTDGRYMCCFFDGVNLQLQTAYSLTADFMTTAYAMDSIVATASITVEGGSGPTIYKRSDGAVLLFVAGGTSTTTWSKCYISISGNGDDWTYLSDILPLITSGPYGGAATMHIPIETASGRLVLAYNGGSNDWGRIDTASYIFTSDNWGITWTQRFCNGVPYDEGISQPCILPSGDIFVCSVRNSGQSYIYQSSDNGSTWALVAEFTHDFSDALRGPCYGFSFYYDEISQTVYTQCLGISGTGTGIYCLKSPTAVTFINKTAWKYIYDPSENSGYGGRIYPVGNSLAFSAWSWILGIPPGSKELPAKSISITRSKGAAAGLTVTADNKGGVYSPDSNGAWNQVLWPNAEIIVEQGYGSDLIQTFTGSLDTVEMSSFPQGISLSARDAMKAALDNTVTGSTGNHVLIYTNSTVESIFISLCNFAGITYGTVGATGMTLARKEFSWESFGDAIQWLAELVGFEVVADELGVVHFRRDWYPTGGTSVYAFTQGVDLVSVNYTIDDADLYNKVIVHGKDADDKVVELAVTVPGSDYWRLLPHKILKIDAPDCKTTAELQVIADRAIYLMMSKFRVIGFGAVGVPAIQIGDLVTIIEASTTVSEVYRITDLGSTQDDNGYIMSGTAHWYSHG